MDRSLSQTERAQLEARLILPVIVGQMLQGLEPMDQIAEFTIHDMLSRMEPDTALLCIALCAEKIAYAHKDILIASVMGVESASLIDEYAPLWWANATGQKLKDQDVHDLLEHLPEDFESLEVLLKTTHISFDRQSDVAPWLCDIFAFQAESFKAYTENYFESGQLFENHQADNIKEDNVIAFPVSRTRH